MNVGLEGTTEVTGSQEPDAKLVTSFALAQKIEPAFCWQGGPLFWGAKQGQTNKQTDKEQGCTKKMYYLLIPHDRLLPDFFFNALF